MSAFEVPQWIINEHPFDPQPHRYVLPKMLRRHLGNVCFGVEIGVAYGSTTIALLEEFPSLYLYAIDPYVPYDPKDTMSMSTERMDEMYEFAKNRFEGKHIKLVRKTSAEASKFITDDSLDFAFIDAVHRYEAVREDIGIWYPKIRPGGFLTGHDYCEYWPGIQKAVNERAAELGRELLVWDHFDGKPARRAIIWAMQKP